MIGALLLVLAAVLGAACAALGWAQVRRIRRALPADARVLAASLKRVPIEARIGELGRRAPAGSWAERLAADWTGAADEPSRVAALNEALADLDHDLEAGKAWPEAAVRIAVFGTLLLAASAFLAAEPGWVIAIVAAGGAGAVVSVMASRRARETAREQREGVDALIETLLGGPARPASPRARRRMRR